MDTIYSIPATFEAGTTVIYYRNPSDFPVTDSWVLTLHLAGPKRLDVEGTEEDGYHKFTLTAAQTGGLDEGTYQWVERASKAGAVYTSASGTVAVTLNLATAGDGDAQSENEILLALIKLRLRGRLTSDMENYSIRGRTVAKIPTELLIRYRNALETAVARERNPSSFGRKVVVNFGRPAS